MLMSSFKAARLVFLPDKNMWKKQWNYIHVFLSWSQWVICCNSWPISPNPPMRDAPPKSWAKSSEIARTPTQSLSWIQFRSRTQIPRWTSPWEKNTARAARPAFDPPRTLGWETPRHHVHVNHVNHVTIVTIVTHVFWSLCILLFQNVIEILPSSIHHTLHTQNHLDCSLSNKPPAHLNMSLLGILCNSQVEGHEKHVSLRLKPKIFCLLTW